MATTTHSAGPRGWLGLGCDGDGEDIGSLEAVPRGPGLEAGVALGGGVGGEQIAWEGPPSCAVSPGSGNR
jgi:hypothetical protein